MSTNREEGWRKAHFPSKGGERDKKTKNK